VIRTLLSLPARISRARAGLRRPRLVAPRGQAASATWRRGESRRRRCGLNPQYAQLEALYEEPADRGLTVIGFPSDQFGGQEPGSAAEIAEFCSTTYGVTFPMSAKIEVDGPGRDPIYERPTEIADAEGEAGDIQWNFEKS